MATALLTRKIDLCFGHLDVDGNGHVDREDLLGLGSRLLAEFGEHPTSPKGIELMDGMMRFWVALSAATDADSDGRITPDEYRAGMIDAFVTTANGFDQAFRPMAEGLCSLLDTDGDGHVNRAEFAAFQRVLRTAGPDADLAFDKLDRDGDGELTVEEILAAMRDYYTSEDDNALGNWLFGQV